MSATIKTCVIGASGRMGSTVCEAVETASDLELVGRYDVGDEWGDAGGAQVAVEFTVPVASWANVEQCVTRGIHVVVGTTGWNEEKLTRLSALCAEHPEVGVLIAPNFALGAVLMMKFAAQAARYFSSAEIVETHHPRKVDAPSGTAALTAELMGQAREAAGVPSSPDATETDPGGARGATVHGVHVHAVRLQGMVAHQEVLLGNEGELLTIRHDSFDRVSFMPGVVHAVRTVGGRPGLTHGLEHYLEW